MINYKNKKVNVIGAARSGLASAVVLSKLGADIFLSEYQSSGNFTEAENTLLENNISFEFDGHTDRVYDCELIVSSPGVPIDSAVLQEAASRGIKIISELELGFQLCRGSVLAITGSNGKTTTTSLVGEIFRQAGIQHVVAGNIGTPFASVAGQIEKPGWAIVEVSTFQLEWIEKFKPKVAVVLNITPDHLDRHKTMANYIDLKLKIFANQNGTDTAIVNHDDENLSSYRSQSDRLLFSTSKNVADGCFIENERLSFSNDSRQHEIIKVKDIGIKGPHNLANACAAVACCKAAGVANSAIAAGLKSFKGVEHRLEMAGLIGGVSYVNDSKATNVDAVYWALQSVPVPLILIAGGRDKAGDFSRLNELVKQNVVYVITIGEAAAKITATFESITEIKQAKTLEDAVRIAYEDSRNARSVLLSPGCASFDMFENFEHRGDVFKNTVADLKKEKIE